YDRTVRAFADEQSRDERALRLFEVLERLYRSPASREEKLAERERIFAAHVAALRREVASVREDFYDRLRRGELGEAERVAAAERLRELEAAVPEGPVNNAVILHQRRYGRYEEFRRRFERANGDWRTFFR